MIMALCACMYVCMFVRYWQDYSRHLLNCYVAESMTSSSLAEGVMRVLFDGALREQLIVGGVETAHKFRSSRVERHASNVLRYQCSLCGAL